jgi:hypothetical protein
MPKSPQLLRKVASLVVSIFLKANHQPRRQGFWKKTGVPPPAHPFRKERGTDGAAKTARSGFQKRRKKFKGHGFRVRAL